MLEAISENLGAYIPFLISALFMAIIGGAIVYNDFKRLSVKTYILLSLVLVGFIGVIIGKIATGEWEWYWLLIFPVYIVLEILNTKFNHNKFIGQADVCIANGVVALLVPMFIQLWGVAQSAEEYASSVLLIRFGAVILNLALLFVVGSVLAMICGLIKWLINRNSAKKEVRESTEFGNAAIATAVAILNAKGFADDQKEHLKDLLKENPEDIKNKTSPKLRGTKIPVCLAFIPVFILAVYMSIFGAF